MNKSEIEFANTRAEKIGRLIDADLLIKDGWTLEKRGKSGRLIRTMSIADVPTVDAVEVVRCKDCKWCHAGYCERYDDLIPFGCINEDWDNWYCAEGERRTHETIDSNAY